MILDVDIVNERDEILSHWIDSLGDFQIRDDSEKMETLKSEIELNPDLDWISRFNFSEDLELKLLNIEKAKRWNINYYVSLVEVVGNPDFRNELSEVCTI